MNEVRTSQFESVAIMQGAQEGYLSLYIDPAITEEHLYIQK